MTKGRNKNTDYRERNQEKSFRPRREVSATVFDCVLDGVSFDDAQSKIRATCVSDTEFSEAMNRYAASVGRICAGVTL